ncbi:MAG: amidohydrolase, partial [Bacteroidota bacterium]
MRTTTFILICCLGFFSTLQAQLSKAETNALAELDAKSDAYFDIAKQIWDLAEVGYQEYKSSELLQETLKKEGFT